MVRGRAHPGLATLLPLARGTGGSGVSVERSSGVSWADSAVSQVWVFFKRKKNNFPPLCARWLGHEPENSPLKTPCLLHEQRSPPILNNR